MANRIVGNIYILDSGLQTLNYLNLKLMGVGFYGANTTAALVLTLASDTRDAIVAIGPNVIGAGAWSAYVPLGGVYVSDTIRVLNLTAGTGWLYLG